MLTVANADYSATPQIDNGLDVTVTGYILDTRYGTGLVLLGTLSSTVSIDEATAATGPVPTGGSGGSFSIVIPIATLQSAANGRGLVFVTVNSTTAFARPWTIFLRPWLQAECDHVCDDFVGGITDQVKAPSLRDAYTGFRYSADDMVEVDGRPVHAGMGYQSKNLDDN